MVKKHVDVARYQVTKIAPQIFSYVLPEYRYEEKIMIEDWSWQYKEKQKSRQRSRTHLQTQSVARVLRNNAREE